MQRNYWKFWRRPGRRCRTGCRAKPVVTRPGEPGRTRKRPGEAAAGCHVADKHQHYTFEHSNLHMHTVFLIILTQCCVMLTTMFDFSVKHVNSFIHILFLLYFREPRTLLLPR